MIKITGKNLKKHKNLSKKKILFYKKICLNKNPQQIFCRKKKKNNFGEFVFDCFFSEKLN